MGRGKVLLGLVTITIILLATSFSINANAGEAGVGVLNVSPKFSEIRLVQQDNLIRVYVIVSDYNSWEDIYDVKVGLECYGSEIATFAFKQYEDISSFEKINEFSENSKEKDLLLIEKCSFSHSDEDETVEDRCNLNILFVFRMTGFTHFNIIVSDREGSTASINIEYNAEEMMRSPGVIIIPGLHEPITVVIPSYLLTLMAALLGLLGIVFFVKKKEKNKKRRVAYEKG